MSDEIEDALRRELQGQWVPFDEARAEDMVRAAAETGLADTPRAWVAPLAAAAAVVVIGGGVALANAGGGGNSGASGPGNAAPVSSSGDNQYATGPCKAFASDDAGVVTVYPATAVPDSLGALGSGMYTAYAEGSATADATPPVNAVGTATPAHVPPSPPVSAVSGPVANLTDVPPPPTVSYVPLDGGSSGTPEIGRTDTIYICSVGPATTLGTDGCTARRHSEICVGSVDCPATADSASATASADASVTTTGPGPDVICIATEPGTDVPPLPTESPSSSPPSSGSAGSASPDTVSPSSSSGGGSDSVSFTVQVDVLPGQPGGKAHIPDVPAGYQLDITGLTFRNPAADEGKLTISLGDTKLVDENLADFRHLDSHFTDQPIVLSRGTSFVVGVTCANTNSDCTPAVDVTGHLEPVN